MERICEKGTLFIPSVSEIANKHETFCTVDWAKNMFDTARRESCGKCVFCREGTIQIYTIIKDISEGKGEQDDIELLAELFRILRENAGCEQARTAAGNLLFALENYPDEWEAHIKRKRCPALACKKLISVHILPENCQGCGDCTGSCFAGAIAGGPGMIHVIDPETCNRCGACLAICQYNAIQKAGAIKPKTPETPVPVGSWEAGGMGRRRRRGV